MSCSFDSPEAQARCRCSSRRLNNFLSTATPHGLASPEEAFGLRFARWNSRQLGLFGEPFIVEAMAQENSCRRTSRHGSASCHLTNYRAIGKTVEEARSYSGA
jgi:3-methyl-2-oxobutanoate hydroxymethyltransferase